MKYNVEVQEPNKKLYVIQNDRLIERRQSFKQRSDVGADALVSTDGTILLTPAEERSSLVPRLVLYEVELDERQERAKLTPALPVSMQQRIVSSLAVTQGLMSTTANLTLSQGIHNSLREYKGYWMRPRESVQLFDDDNTILNSFITQPSNEGEQLTDENMNTFVYYPPFNVKMMTVEAIYPTKGLLCTSIPNYCMEQHATLSHEYTINYVRQKVNVVTATKVPKRDHTSPSSHNTDNDTDKDSDSTATSEEADLSTSVELEYTPYAQRLIQRQKEILCHQDSDDETKAFKETAIYRKEGSIHYIHWDNADPDASEILERCKTSPYAFIRDAFLHVTGGEHKAKLHDELLCILACFHELCNSFRSQKITSTRFATFLSVRYSGRIKDDTLTFKGVPDLLPYLCVLALYLSSFQVNLTSLGEVLLHSPTQLAKLYSGLMCRLRKLPNGDYVAHLKPPLRLPKKGRRRNLGSK
ncbi:A49-like RNA polymerase I associated factor [Giardia muris]|uniref:A49-like RNA polymerase I associated factor n=1 Tax=Giardia muris TaxID=5742 RepID=A0A4Z1T772_GIAMU|nr:A49-like RNA polymerase I associated factor [Giardia muris]|eukprot:TNJ29923.1 A49-like RNA polymerase I associated factor [Giardia muris]